VKTGRIKWTTGQIDGINTSIGREIVGALSLMHGKRVGIATRATRTWRLPASTTSIANWHTFSSSKPVTLDSNGRGHHESPRSDESGSCLRGIYGV